MNKIKQFRKKMGMTQKELSEKSGICNGVEFCYEV